MPKSASIKSLRRGGAFFYNLGVGKRSSNFDSDSDVNGKEDGGDEEKQKPAALEREARVVARTPPVPRVPGPGEPPFAAGRPPAATAPPPAVSEAGPGSGFTKPLSCPPVQTRGHL
ncbi:hypothetical protein MDA_GLEAN10010337 [Myotis davidii]|uniref:Uncharacterized protein n=1 Tax=Myotis davidii TaxID=225400 RepID=L5M5F6_MYODS|nr:hypothetical protein MDA_GLEAN10010337 [Myotis davidii]